MRHIVSETDSQSEIQTDCLNNLKVRKMRDKNVTIQTKKQTDKYTGESIHCLGRSQTNKETDRKRGRQTKKQTDKKTVSKKLTNKEADRQ